MLLFQVQLDTPELQARRDSWVLLAALVRLVRSDLRVFKGIEPLDPEQEELEKLKHSADKASA